MGKYIEMIFTFLVYFLITNTCVRSKEIPKNPKIVIIGAGASGIAAASKLFENGFTNVIILEAEDRIGGRIYTTQLGNSSVDLGAQHVHGQTGNVVYKLAQSFDLLHMSDSESDSEYFDSLGIPLRNDLSRELTEFFEKFTYDYKFDNNTKDKSYGEHLERMFDEHFKNSPEIINDKKKYLHIFEFMVLAEQPADSWYDLPITALEEYKEFPGDQEINWKNRGYSTVLDILMKRYPDPNKELPVMKNIILNTEVTSIDYSNCVKGLPILIKTADGEIYKADHVIITVSLGVLKEKYETLFKPPLPIEKVAVIEGFEMGDGAKIYFLFDEPFWGTDDNKVSTHNFVWNDAERKEIEADPEKKWLIGMYEAVVLEYRSNILVSWVVGEYAREMEKLPEDKVFKHAVENLHRFLDQKYNVSEPVAILRTQWHSNPHFRGTYSYRSVKTESKRVYAKMLEKPINPENLAIQFAGEATSRNRYATVDGAIISGWKAADRLIKRYNYGHKRRKYVYTNYNENR